MILFLQILYMIYIYIYTITYILIHLNIYIIKYINILFIPIKILLIFIIYILYLILLYYSEFFIKFNKYFILDLVKIINKICLNIFNIQLEYDNDIIKKYNKYINEGHNFILIYNHINAFDPIIISYLFNNTSLLARDNIPSTIPFLKSIVFDKLKYLLVIDGKTTNNIIEYMKNRKKEDNILAIAPDGGYSTKEPYNISEFKSGVFVGKYPVLPFIIKYDNIDLSYNFEYGEGFIHSILKFFLYDNIKIKVKLLDIIYPYDNESINDYKLRVHNIMNKNYKIL